MLIDWNLEDENKLSNSVGGQRKDGLIYPHPTPLGWTELAVWTGIAEMPLWAVVDKQHVEKIARSAAYRLIVRCTRPSSLPIEPTVQKEVLRRVVSPDFRLNKKTGKATPAIKYRWQFLEFDHYASVDDLKGKAEEYHQQLLADWESR